MTRHRSVKRIFSFSSGTLNRLGIWGAVIGQLAIVPPACSILARGEAVQVPHVDHLRRLLERVREPALGDAPDERHLPALEARPFLSPGAGRLAFPAPACGLSDAGAGTAPLADARPVRAARWLEGRQREEPDFALGCLGSRRPSAPPPPPRPRCRLHLRHDLFSRLRGRHLDEVAHLMKHAPQRRVVLLHDRVLVMLQPQGLERAPLERGPADPGAHLPDAELTLAHGRQRTIAARLALAIFPGRRLPSHAPPPAATGTGWPRPRCRAPWRRAAPW